MENREYPLYITVFLKIFVVGMLVLFTALGVCFIAVSQNHFLMYDAYLLFAGIFWLIVMIVPWCIFLSMPYRISVKDGTISFKSLISLVEISPKDIISIKPSNTQVGYLIIKHSKGYFRIVNQFDNFHTFINELRCVNPEIIIRGC